MELIDYVLKLKHSMDTVQGEESVIEITSQEDLANIANDLKADVKEEMEEIGVTLATDDIVLITYVYDALAIYLYRNDSNKIIDENEDIVDMFTSLLEESGVPEGDIPDILENIFITDKFKTILELNYKDDSPSMELTEFSKFLVKQVTNEFQYIEPIKLVNGGLDKIFDLFEIETLENIEILYILSLFNADYNDIFLLLEEHPVDFYAIAELYNQKQKEMATEKELKDKYEQDG